MPKPIVSVAIVTYNQEKYISRAIEGALEQQTEFPFELVIGEDCSTDNTRQIVLDYQKKYPEKIRVITSKENVGAIPNSLRVIKESRGKYIAFCEGDDYWCDPIKLQKQVDIMEADPEISMCFHATYYENVLHPEERVVHRYHKDDHVFTLGDLLSIRGRHMYNLVSSMIRVDLMPDLSEWYHKALVDDTPLILLSASVGKIYYLNEVMAVYRQYTESSWTVEFITKKNFRIKHLEHKLRFWDDFDQYSGRKHTKQIKRTINAEFLKVLVDKDLTEQDIEFICKNYGQKTNGGLKLFIALLNSLKLYSAFSKTIKLLRRIKYICFPPPTKDDHTYLNTRK